MKRSKQKKPSKILQASLARHRERGVPFVPVAELVPWIENPRDNARAVPAVVDSLQAFGWTNPVLYRADGRMVEAGHTRLLAAAHLGLEAVPAIALDHDERQAKLYALADNRLNELAPWTPGAVDLLRGFDPEEVQLAGWSDLDGWANGLFPASEPDPYGKPDPAQQGSLARRFGVPPVSVLDARSGYWRDRKLGWLQLGLRSYEGREQLDRATVASDGLNRGTAAGGSLFDPVLAELLVRWFCPPGGLVLDPFAGGSVRGIVSAACGRQYLGIDLRREQVEANEQQWAEIAPRLPAVTETVAQPAVVTEDYMPELTPVERRGSVWLKRDDLFSVAGVQGGKVRTCWRLAQRAVGLVTAGSRSSPQVNIVAHIAQRLGIPCRVHTPSGEPSPEVQAAIDAGAERLAHVPGHNSVIVARAREDAAARRWTEIPFGMECQAAVDANRTQVANLPADVQRLVVPVGSGMTLAGILWGLVDCGRTLPVLGVVVGADPEKRLDRWAPPQWRQMVELVPAGVEYDEHVQADVDGVVLDPVYEAKAVRFLRAGDCLWCVGIRQTAVAVQRAPAAQVAPQWVTGDSLQVLPQVPVEADMILSCPPYADLEVYSDHEADLSNMGYPKFLEVYRAIIAQAVARLRPNRWIGWVVGEVRGGPGGAYRNLVGDTIQAFLDAGASYYNEAILVTGLGSVPVRAGRQFEASRKMGKTHQNVLVFCKGDPKLATEAVGRVDFGEAQQDPEDGED